MSDASDHVVEARRRARQVLAGESHLGAVDDWRVTLASGRDALIVTWIAWMALQGAGGSESTTGILLAAASAFAIFVGIGTARATHTQVQYYIAELERERSEIRGDLAGERAEVHALYAAKGFQEPLLSQIVDTLTADEDRLLKVMMEEELGLHMYHVNHPMIVGAGNFVGALVAGLLLAIPTWFLPPPQARGWLPIEGFVLLIVVSWITARCTHRGFMEVIAVDTVAALVCGGAAYWIAEWLVGGRGA